MPWCFNHPGLFHANSINLFIRLVHCIVLDLGLVTQPVQAALVQVGNSFSGVMV